LPLVKKNTASKSRSEASDIGARSSVLTTSSRPDLAAMSASTVFESSMLSCR
jgi:hypothetical protein